jgi:RNA polymerase sigma-70 factor, ECF subfamily
LSAIEQSLTESLGRMRPDLTNRAHRIVGNRSDAEDAVQDAALRAWQSRGRFRDEADPAPWLRTIVTRTAIDLARERGRRAKLAGASPSGAVTTPEERVVRTEILTAVGDAASRLTPEVRRVLFLHDVDGMTSREIARLDDVPYHTVRTRLRRARLSLRNELTELNEAI